MITWWLRPQTPSEKSWIDFFRNDIRIIEVIWKRYHNMINEGKKKESRSSLKINIIIYSKDKFARDLVGLQLRMEQIILAHNLYYFEMN